MQLELVVENPGVLEEEMATKVFDVLSFIEAKALDNMIKNGTPDTGNLLRSSKIEGDTLVFDAPYAEFVEFGTLPHPVSASKLFNWCRRKLKLDEKQAWAAAHAIAAKIRKEGTEEQPFLRPAIEEAIRWYNR